MHIFSYHVLKTHINRVEDVVHSKFACRRPAFLFQNSFSGLNFDEPDVKMQQDFTRHNTTTKFDHKTKRGKIAFDAYIFP